MTGLDLADPAGRGLEVRLFGHRIPYGHGQFVRLPCPTSRVRVEVIEVERAVVERREDGADHDLPDAGRHFDRAAG